MAFACAVSRLGDFHLAEDAVQEAFVAAYFGLENLLEPKAFPGWLCGIVRHQCERIRRSRPVAPLPIEYAESMASTDNPALHAEQRETADAVMSAVMALPGRRRSLLPARLHPARDFGISEIDGSDGFSAFAKAEKPIGCRLRNAAFRSRSRPKQPRVLPG